MERQYSSKQIYEFLHKEEFDFLYLELEGDYGFFCRACYSRVPADQLDQHNLVHAVGEEIIEDCLCYVCCRVMTSDVRNKFSAGAHATGASHKKVLKRGQTGKSCLTCGMWVTSKHNASHKLANVQPLCSDYDAARKETKEVGREEKAKVRDSRERATAHGSTCVDAAESMKCLLLYHLDHKVARAFTKPLCREDFAALTGKLESTPVETLRKEKVRAQCIICVNRYKLTGEPVPSRQSHLYSMDVSKVDPCLEEISPSEFAILALSPGFSQGDYEMAGGKIYKKLPEIDWSKETDSELPLEGETGTEDTTSTLGAGPESQVEQEEY